MNEKINVFLKNRAEYYCNLLKELIGSEVCKCENDSDHCQCTIKISNEISKINKTQLGFLESEDVSKLEVNDWLGIIFTAADEIVQEDFEGYNFQQFPTNKKVVGDDFVVQSLYSYLSPLVGFWLNYDVFRLAFKHEVKDQPEKNGNYQSFTDENCHFLNTSRIKNRNPSIRDRIKQFTFTYKTDSNPQKIEFRFYKNAPIIWYEKDHEKMLSLQDETLTLIDKQAENKESDTYFYFCLDSKLYGVNFEIVEDKNVSRSRPINGAMRADEVEDNNYCWTGNKLFSVALGLHIEKYKDSCSDEFYCPTNTPWNKNDLINKINDSSVSNEQQIKNKKKTKKNMQSEIQYYREKENGKLKKSRQKNKPEKPKLPVTYNDEISSSFKSKFKTGKSRSENGKKDDPDPLRKKKKGTRDKTNDTTPGEDLKSNSKERESAGSVMGDYLLLLGEGEEFKLKKQDNTELLSVAKKYLSANELRDAVLKNDEKYTSDNSKPDQEWCHLLGHGDGGKETPDNFVSGSNHCNTEQLAIEAGQRIITHKKSNDFKAKITAYLMDKHPDNKEQDLPQIIDKENKPIQPPLAKSIRYKIYCKKQGNGNGSLESKGEELEKIFDHVFDAQSESFDYNQFKILQWTVRRVLTVASGDIDLIEKYQKSLLKRLYNNLTEQLVNDNKELCKVKKMIGKTLEISGLVECKSEDVENKPNFAYYFDDTTLMLKTVDQIILKSTTPKRSSETNSTSEPIQKSPRTPGKSDTKS
ncbi:hypothetical protein [Lyngbya aestuarii]|uniref:hypothetical protein n=1 Tax=Lyngbya aestuarii TaxID=118322 RepID=UPI00403D609D